MIAASSASRAPEIQLLYLYHYDTVFNNVLHHTNCAQVSEDITQEVFIKRWIKKDELSQVQDWQAYLFAMSKNFALSYLRKKKLQESQAAEIRRCRTESVFDDPCIAHELKKLHAEAIAQLPAQQQRIYRLKREYGFDRLTIARELRISPCTVKDTLQQALKSVKKHVQTSYDEVGQ